MKIANAVTTACSCLALAGCVPASEPHEPAGAAGFVTEPSPASRGEPFTTDDGFTLHFEELVLQAYTSVSPAERVERSYSAGTDRFRWNARDRVELFATALFVGPWRVRVELYDGLSSSSDESDDVVDRGVDPKLARRFRESADEGEEEQLDFGIRLRHGPAALIILRAEKDGRSVRLDAAIGPSLYSTGNLDGGPAFDVQANALVVRPLAISAERLFLGTTTQGQRFEFEPFAAADGDGDGHVTTDELRNVTVSCPNCPVLGAQPPGGPKGTLLDVLRSRLRSMLVSR